MKESFYFKYIFLYIAFLFVFVGAFSLSGCSSHNRTSHSSSNTSSSLTLHSSNMVSNTYDTTNNLFNATFSYSCAGGSVTGNATLSNATLSLGRTSLSSCTFTFTSVTYNNATLSCDTNTTLNSSNSGYETPVLIACSSYTLKLVTMGVFNTSSSANLYVTLLSSPVSSGASPKITVDPIVGTGMNYTCALVKPGLIESATPQIYCWGANNYVLSSAYTVPTQITTSFTPKTLSVGDEMTCALDTSQNVWCMGFWKTAPVTSFTQIAGLTGVQLLSTGLGSACALTSSNNNTLYCWGYIDFTSPASGSFQTTPVTISGFSGAISQIAISNDIEYGAYGAVCAVVGSDSHVECTGNNIYGQLGSGGSGTYHSPASVLMSSGATLTGVTQLSGKNGTFCALTNTTAMYCWGLPNNKPMPFLMGLARQSAYPPTTAGYFFNYYDGTSTYNMNLVVQPNFFGFTSFSDVSTATTGGGSSPGGGYLFANTPTSNTDYSSTFTTTPYTTHLNYATQIPLTLNTISVGNTAICGTFGTKFYCYGADLTLPLSGTGGALQSGTESIWSGASPPILNTSYLCTQYAYGDIGTILGSLDATTYPNNNVTVYTSSTSTGGGVFDLSIHVASGSTGEGAACATYGYSNFDPGHACIVTIDGAISCFGSNECGQVGNGTFYGGATSNMATSPVTVLYPSSLSGTYSGGVTY